MGGLVVGIGGLIDPRALSVGYDNIAQMLQGGMLPAAALLLLVVKAVIWSVALGSGTSGGVLAPLLIMGGGMGAALAGVLPAAEPRLLGAAGHGGDDGRHDALAADRHVLRRGADRRHARAAAADRRLRDRAHGDRAADAPLDPDREGRAARPSSGARISVSIRSR